ncbi:multidrug resistance-associated ABC transporter [Marasmius fiardii PR-910]|nr:multidrug resistance-associated ABC transporter [Marasmius fiardii PR-910]
MGVCGNSGVFDFRNECVRNAWSALVPAGLVLAFCLVSFVNPKPRSPFRRFLTLQEADGLVFEGDAVQEAMVTAGIRGGKTETAVDLPLWRKIVLVFVGMLEVICWIIVGAIPLIVSPPSDLTNTPTTPITADENVWKSVRPFLVAATWTYTVIRPVQRPTPTAPYDLFAIYVFQLISGVVELGGVLYGHNISGLPKPNTMAVVAYSLNLVGLVTVLRVVLSMPLAIPSRRIPKEEIGKSIAPEDYTTLYGWISFSWVSPLILRGKSFTLNESDVPNLSTTLQSRPLLEKFTATDAEGRTLLKRILKANSFDLIIDGAGTVLSSCVMYMSPYFLNHLLKSIDKDAVDVTPADRSNAYIYACLMFFAALTKAHIDAQHLWFGRRAATRIRSELMAAIYDKALKRKDDTSEGKAKSATNDGTEGKKSAAGIGKVVNLMAADANTISNTVTDMSTVWSSPLDLVFGCIYLYQLLGWPAFAGLSVILAAWPLNTLLARRGIKMQKGNMAARDKRMGVVNELVAAVKFIKFYAWEQRWIDRAIEAREKEIDWMIKVRINSILYSILWMTAPILISVVSFALYVLQGNELTVSTAFTAIALFGMIRAPMMILPNFIISILNTKVALDRITAFLGEEEVDEKVSTLKVATAGSHQQSGQPRVEEHGLGLRNATLKWNEVKDSISDKGKTVGTADSIKPRLSSSKSLSSRHSKTGSSNSSIHNSGADTSRASTSETGTVYTTSSQETGFELRDISVMFPEGKLTVVTGPTASGKSALLRAVLGEMTLVSGDLVLHKDSQLLHDASNETYTQTISYASQTPWIRHQTIKENILFGYPYEEKRYRDVVEACALRPDFDVLEDGDETETGAGGVTLSGGQKARVALARAVYARTKYVLLDDPLSAVDSHTSRYLFDNLLCGPLLRGRTVVLVTHHIDLVLPGAHYLVRMVDGRIDTQGTVKALREKGLLEGIVFDARVEEEKSNTTDPQDQNDGRPGERKKPGRRLVQDEHRETGRVKWRVHKKYLEASRYYIWILLTAFVVANQFIFIGEKVWMIQWGKSYRDDKAEASLLLTATSTLTSAFRSFPLRSPGFRTSEHEQVPLYTAHANNSYAANTTGDGGNNSGLFGNDWPSAHKHPLFYVAIYALLGFGHVVVNTICFAAQYMGGIRASRVLFKQLLDKVVRATFRFHDTTPQGRMLNRFGKDMETIDNSLDRNLRSIITAVLSFSSGVFTITVVFPLFLFPAAVFGFIYQELARAYLNTARDLRRMESNSRSPVFSHFGELLEGIVTVRAFSAERQFLNGIHKKIDDTTKIWYAYWMTNRWVMLSFECVGPLIVFITALFSISRKDDAAAGIAGLCISSALTFTGSVYWACRFWTNLELDLNSVERVVEYLEVPQEPPAIIESNRPPAYWPSSRANNNSLIRAENLSVKYAPDLPEVLRNVSFTLRAGERVGLLGRTGSGKSTLAMSILRFVDPSSGKLLIDGIDISTIGTYDLRSRLTFIPQDARLFSGTLRDNLDPFHEHTDEECLDVLYRVQVIHQGHEGVYESRAPSTSASATTLQPPSDDVTTTDMESSRSSGPNAISLYTEVISGGSNFSQGQRQLISLARALLRRAPIIVLDEATSSIDFATDEKIQTAIREEFKESLLLTVAHRLRTVIDYDRLIVLDNGRMVEFDTPLNLIRKKDGIFWNMCLKSGTFKELEAAAVEKAEKDSLRSRR